MRRRLRAVGAAAGGVAALAAWACAARSAAPAGPAGQAAAWTGLVSPAGSLSLEHGGRAVGTLEPALHEAGWKAASLSPSPASGARQPGLMRGFIRAPGGVVVDSEIRMIPIPQGVRLACRLTPQRDVALNSLCMSLTLPASMLAGGSCVVDGQRVPVPVQFQGTQLRSGPCRSIDIHITDGGVLRMRSQEPVPVLVQDDRQWGPTFTVRIGPQMDAASPWPGGKPFTVTLDLTAEGGMRVEQDGPVTIQAGAEWIPLETELEIEPGSVLDFSNLVPWHAPAGALGRVVTDGKGGFAFASRPGRPVRFYGVNLCFSAHYVSHEEADRLARRLRLLGYNTVRFHHYESGLVDRRAATLRLDPTALDQLDYLLAALKSQGLYVTTDLFVSRPVPAGVVWPGESGLVGMDEYKMAVPVNERAFADFKAFARLLLDHKNPHTGLRWADDPAVAWLSLINEGNPGNFQHLLKGRLREDWERAWSRWLAARYPDPGARGRALGRAVPAGDSIPLPAQSDSKAWVLWNVFLAENQRSLHARTQAFLRHELGCRALLTNMNAWTNPVQLQPVRAQLDYVDDHFYVDHPEFIERPWSLPSKCPNISPVAQGAPGGRGAAMLRVFGKPFTLSEFNYSGPGRYRGVGGILTGALGSVQDWGVIWRFAYSHNRDHLFQPSPAGYFDVVTDPLSLASERASLCLFRRGDMRPAPHAVALALTPGEALEEPRNARGFVAGWSGLAWVTRVGSVVAEPPGKARNPGLVLPLGWKDVRWPGDVLEVDPYGPDAGERIVADMRRRGWLSAENPTDLKTSRFQSETGELTIDAPKDALTLDTDRTAGGYAPPGGRIQTRAARVEIADVPATVWVSSVDGRPISTSRRLVVTHLTDLQNSGARYADRGRKVLEAWGGLPHLVRAGRATLTLRLANATRAKVFGLSTGGKRRESVPARVVDGALVVPLSVDRGGRARMVYEIEIG